MKPSSSQAMNLTSDVKYAAMDARVSTEDQGKGFSIPTQIDACQKLAAREGYTVPDAYVLIDEGISGTTMDRPSLRKLRDLVNARAIMAAIVYDPDRLSRNLGHQLLLAEDFERAHVKLLIVSHPLEQGPEGWLFFQMRGALVEYERAKILERLKRGLVGRAKAGHVSGGRLRCGRCGRAMTGEDPLGSRRYRCSSRATFMDPAKRCRGYVNADDVEGRVWQAIAQVLQ